jgi:hypothetical protein
VEAPPYTTPTTGNTFFLNTTASTFLEAELGCTTNGGHLAWYLSAAEQYDVEQFYIRGGYLLPKFHEFYWIGFATLRGQHPEFSWTDGNAKTKYRRCGWLPLLGRMEPAPAACFARRRPGMHLKCRACLNLPCRGHLQGGHTAGQGAQRDRRQLPTGLRGRQRHSGVRHTQGLGLGGQQVRRAAHLHVSQVQ